MTKPFGSVLVANRGEIACRVMRTAKQLGYRVLAIASEADREAPHVQLADDFRIIGPAPVGQSYLDPQRVLQAAKEMGAEAIHPGYGFLSENADFARKVKDQGLVFIGPSADAIDLMGDKARAKRAMIDAGVPCIPGYEAEDQSPERFIEAAASVGYPVMVKAAAGGGGRGMRIVRTPDRLADALNDARAEAQSAFGSGELILEKAVENARHVEIQVFGDAHGNIIHLGERDCSLQRRNQKVVEEAPSPAVDPTLRAQMGAAAVEAARAVAYQGAGTVEFLLADDRAFYFLEMNTRLQVEHPVTEEVTGLDLVALQLQVARGEPLGLGQDDVQLRGHSIEVRLYAEDPAAGFLPATGPIKLWGPPAGIRIDGGIVSGGEVSPYYDPMVAKLIATGPSRADAIRRLTNALKETALLGFKTNRAHLLSLLESEVFVAGEARTTSIDQQGAVATTPPPNSLYALAAAIQYQSEAARLQRHTNVPDELTGWSSGGAFRKPYLYCDGEVRCDIEPRGQDLLAVVGKEQFDVTLNLASPNRGRAQVNGQQITFSFVEDGTEVWLSADLFDLHLDNLAARRQSAGEAAGEGAVTAAMHGLIQEVLVTEGAEVKKGQRLLTLEAMKMQHEISAPVDGTVRAVAATAGDQVQAGALLVEIEPNTEE